MAKSKKATGTKAKKHGTKAGKAPITDAVNDLPLDDLPTTQIEDDGAAQAVTPDEHSTDADKPAEIEPVESSPEAEPLGLPAEAPAEPTSTDEPAEAEPTPKTTKDQKPRKSKAAKPPKEKKLSAIDAAAQVLEMAGQPMNCIEMIEAMDRRGLWSSPNGATPHATLYSAILREINTKGDASRFMKAERGTFARK